MSVIFGIKNKDNLVIAGDRRGSTKSGETISDNIKKVKMINNQVAIATAGNAAIEVAITNSIENITDINSLTTDDVVTIISEFYGKVQNAKVSFILSLPFVFIVAGNGKNGHPSLISGVFSKGILSASEVPMVLFHPEDTSQNVCNNIFAKYYHTDYNNFVEKTISDVSKLSNLVSSNGDKWIYSYYSKTGCLLSF